MFIDERMCLVKTLLGKTLWDKNLVKKKSTSFYIILFFASSISPPHVNLHHQDDGVQSCEPMLKSSPWQRLCK